MDRMGAALHAAIDRREAWLWILALFVLSNVALQADEGTLWGLFVALGEYNLIYWLCFAVIGHSILSSRAVALDRTTGVAFIFTFVSLTGIALTDTSALDGIVATVLGVVLYKRYAHDPALRRAGILMLALAANLFWAKAVFALLKEQIIFFDTVFAEAMLRIAGYEVERTINTLSAGSGFYISVVGACSAFNNLSFAVLACLSAIIGVRGSLRRSDIGGIALVCVLLILFNTVRLSVFASSSAAYQFWHNGEGAQVLGILQTVVTLGAAAVLAHRACPEPG